MDSRKSVRNLAETLHSLLGLKAHLTSNWVKSVCDIIRTLPSESSATDFETKGIMDGDSGSDVQKIKDEIAALASHINQLNIKRREVLNDFLDLKGNIRVFCRIRPISMGEHFGRLRPVLALDTSSVLLRPADNKGKKYSFDKVFHPASSQDEVFSEVEPVIKSVLDGSNACIFAYGQTGTGKTFTMEGSPDDPGIVPRAVEALFQQALDSNHAFLIRFSMLEIYMGNLKDLLVSKPTRSTNPMPPCLSIQTDPKGGIEIENLVAIQVNDCNQALRLYRLGCRFRSTASTNSNTTSSRSHCMIRMAITCFDAPERPRETNKIWLVDLGGSERVLKTKASGKRLHEGKAINLSLCALGDVINALQRKKCHIPFRNSKLTQVLKDSLGDDAKTLMLVHVSPKEEDLCETICSLNFATRVKSIHLGNEDTIEVREQKEVAMADLQEKMKQIEDERLHVRQDIELLNKKLENLTGKKLSSEEQLETYHLSTEEPLIKNRIGDTTATPLSKLPRFMRPTICSQRKCDTGSKTSEGRDTVLVRRRPPSHRAESVTLPVKDRSAYNSDCSISRSSCLMEMSIKNSADSATECSQDTSDTDAKIIDIREQERGPRSSVHLRADISHVQKETNKFNDLKFSKIDNWLHLQKNEANISGYTQTTKRVLALPIPKKKQKSNEQIKPETFCDEKVYNYDFTTQNVVNHNKKDKPVTAGKAGRHTSEVVIEKPLTTLKDLFDEDSISNFTSVSQTNKGETMIRIQDSADISSVDNKGFSTFSLQDVFCGRFDKYRDDNGVNAMSIKQAVEGETQCSDSFLPKNCGFGKNSPSDSDSCIAYSKGSSYSILEIESCYQQAATELHLEDSKRQNFDVLFHPLAKEMRLDRLQMRSQRALFANNVDQKDLIPFHIQEGKTPSKGICSILEQKFEILCASALLGLGFYSLGFEHDFFYGLML